MRPKAVQCISLQRSDDELMKVTVVIQGVRVLGPRAMTATASTLKRAREAGCCG